MRNVIQEVVHWDVGTNGEEEIEPTLASVNLAKEEPVLSKEPSITPTTPVMRISPLNKRLVGIPEADKEKASVKDSVTSRLPAQESKEVMEPVG